MYLSYSKHGYHDKCATCLHPPVISKLHPCPLVDFQKACRHASRPQMCSHLHITDTEAEWNGPNLFSGRMYKRLCQVLFFLPCSAMHSADYAVTRCLSVRHVLVFCRNGWTYLFSNFFKSGSHTILVFLYQMVWEYSDGYPGIGGVQCKGVWKKIRVFDQYLALSRKWYKTEP